MSDEQIPDPPLGQQPPPPAGPAPAQPGHMQPWTQYATPVPSEGAQQTMSQMTQRLQTVIDAAERAAQAIRYDAEEQARRHLAEAQHKADQLTAERVALISELTDDLIRHAGVVRERSEQMVLGLEEAISSVTDKFDQTDLDSLLEPREADAPGIGSGEAEAVEPEAAAPPPPIPAPPAKPETPPAAEIDEPTAVDEAIEEAEAEAEALEAAEAEELEGSDPAAEAGLAEVLADPGPPVEPEPDPESLGPPPSAPPPPPAEAAPPEGLDAEAPAPPAPAPDPAPPEDAPQAEPPAAELQQEALLHATRLAVAGNDRASIATALADEYGIGDPDPILDRVLGSA